MGRMVLQLITVGLLAAAGSAWFTRPASAAPREYVWSQRRCYEVVNGERQPVGDGLCSPVVRILGVAADKGLTVHGDPLSEAEATEAVIWAAYQRYQELYPCR